MAPHGAAGRGNNDEIPIAQRLNPSKRRVRNQLRTAAIFVFISFFLFFLFFSSGRFRLFLLSTTSNNLDSLPGLSEDESLLGHYPYPEAELEDLVTVYPGLEVHEDTYVALMDMSEAAKRDGVSLVYLSGYRSHALQEEIFFEIKSIRNQTASERSKVSAPPGYSEHSTGYAIDLGDSRRRDTDFQVEFEETEAFKWLKRNAARFHFILSYPRDNPQGISYEPWHWRFEGTAEALKAFEKVRNLYKKN